MSENTPDPQEREMRSTLARVLWAVDKGQDKPKGEEAAASFRAERSDLMIKSKKIIRRLERHGVTLTANNDA